MRNIPKFKLENATVKNYLINSVLEIYLFRFGHGKTTSTLDMGFIFNFIEISKLFLNYDDGKYLQEWFMVNVVLQIGKINFRNGSW